MRKAQKRQAEAFLKLLAQAHEEIRGCIKAGKTGPAMSLLAQCQEGAVELGGLIEKTEGEGSPAVGLLGEYCETLYEIHEELAGSGAVNPGGSHKRLKKSLIRVENSVRNDIGLRYEIVFLPYKASMWDSLESVWRAAEGDPLCDAYVVPIPYYDRNPDGSFGACHYEGDQLPSYVPVTHYSAYHLEEREPDVVYIHNPYDDVNYVTSVDPAYYSWKLKEHTECLVYIPYYATAGGMSEAQAVCPAYDHADCIVIQAEKYRQFFDPHIPDEKFLVMGSPKFDSVIHKCQNPPEPPKEWAGKMAGRKVYFYNTSLGGMLGDTEAFLKKMRYVFDIFKGREDACLLWRPHPLLESTFASMRAVYKPWFEELKREFIEEGIGIYDDTADIESTIALSDVYIGDCVTSVTSLFGVAGKPLFVLNNHINTLPGKDDWRGERLYGAFGNRYEITANNQLWISENRDYHYKFYMDLGTGYSQGWYYRGVVEVGDTLYVLPGNARHLLIIRDKKIRRIDFKVEISREGAFSCFFRYEKYIFMLPVQYPFLLRFNMETEEICYIDSVREFLVREVEGEYRVGGACLYDNNLIFASPVDNRFLFLDADTLKIREYSSNSRSNLGTQGFVIDEDGLWLLPLNGMVLTKWNPKTGYVQEYGDLPDGFKSVRQPFGIECKERPFGNLIFIREEDKKRILLSPYLGNMFVELDWETGRMEEWKLPFSAIDGGKNGYFATNGIGGFAAMPLDGAVGVCRVWYAPERRLYEVNINTNAYKEIEIEFDYDDLVQHEPGFMERSEWLQYSLDENVFNSLKDLLDDNITGNQFDRERQLHVFSKINANTEGTCGENIHASVKSRLVH
jgi:hypothetical protein